MSKICLDSGTIQAFLDGEIAAGKLSAVSDHLAFCDACAFALADAEEESALVFAALDGELNTLVPTQRLWSKINDSIGEEKRNVSVWQKIRGYISVITANPSLAVAAAILMIFGVFALFLTLRPAAENSPLMASTGSNINVSSPTRIDMPQSPKIINAPLNAEKSTPRIERAAVRPIAGRDEVQKSSVKTNLRQQLNDVPTPKYAINRPRTPDSRLQTQTAAYLPGEESYVKTIASLTDTVDRSKNEILKPSAQISFARDLAVVDDAISKMKAEVKKNPKNDSAKQVLYSSYQNKIDLLNSVAQKSELMASLR